MSIHLWTESVGDALSLTLAARVVGCERYCPTDQYSSEPDLSNCFAYRTKTLTCQVLVKMVRHRCLSIHS
jgi:hypothetical protein